MRIRALLVAGLLAGAAWLGAAPAQAAVRSCHSKADFNVLVSSVRNMTCRQAVRDIRRHRGSIAAAFSTPGGFRCRRVSGGRLAGQWRCVKGRRAYRFEFED